MKLIYRFTAVAALFSSQVSLAGPLVVDGVQYKNEEQARLAIQRSVQVRVEQVPQDYLKAVNVAPIGGKFAVEIPNLEEARLKYVVVTGGLFKPGKDTQNVVAESIIANIKWRFLAYKKIGFIEDVVFLEGSSPVNSSEYDYVVSFVTEFDGERSPQAGQFRKTEWFVQGRTGGIKQSAVTAYGIPTSVNDLVVFSGLRNAVAVLKKAAEEHPAQISEQTKANAVTSQPQSRASITTPVSTTAPSPAVTPIVKQETKPNAATSRDIGSVADIQSGAAKSEDVVLERALSRCTNIGFKRDTDEFRSCVTEQIKILSK
jgi:hypothetical protein